jgi:hypothetical protein
MARGFKSGGRKAGIPNKINAELRGLVLLEKGHDPIAAMIDIARNPKASLELRGKMNAELAGYVYCKRKSVDFSGEVSVKRLIGVPLDEL